MAQEGSQEAEHIGNSSPRGGKGHRLGPRMLQPKCLGGDSASSSFSTGVNYLVLGQGELPWLTPCT